MELKELFQVEGGGNKKKRAAPCRIFSAILLALWSWLIHLPAPDFVSPYIQQKHSNKDNQHRLWPRTGHFVSAGKLLIL